MDQVTSEQKSRARPRLTQRAAAWALYCTYQHLSATIKGKRQSASLSARYRDLLERHDAGQLTEPEASAIREFQIIGRASKVLGVFPDHLISVLAGKGRDASLLKRFRALAALSSEPAVMLSMISRYTLKHKLSNENINENADSRTKNGGALPETPETTQSSSTVALF
jgi:hypothetical protein